jgi:DNA-binding XRE family transcriptional regulator
MNNSVRKRREELGLTQEELSIKSNVSRPTISMIETNSLDNIESKTMLKLAIALDCDIGDIFFKENVVLTQHKETKEV